MVSKDSAFNSIIQKLYTNSHLNNLTTFCEAVANAAGKQIEVVHVPEDQQTEVAKKTLTGLYPFLETSEGFINESVAIAAYLAHGTPLLGSNNVERA